MRALSAIAVLCLLVLIPQYALAVDPPEQYRFSLAWGTTGSGNLQFNEPTGICFDNAHIFVADRVNNRIMVFTTDGAYTDQFGTIGSGPNNLLHPWDVIVDPGTHNVYITDAGNNRVVVRNSAWAPIANFGSAGSGDSQFDWPEGISLGVGVPGIYICDRFNNRVDVWNSPSVHGSNWAGDATHTLAGPGGFASASAIMGYLADTENHRILKISGGSVIDVWTGFNYPYQLTVDASGNVFVADTMNNRVVKLDSAGTVLAIIGVGQLDQPRDVVVDPSGYLYVTDDGHNRVVRYRINHAPPAPSTLTISPAHPTDADALGAHATAPADPDGDPITFQYRWYYRTGGAGAWTMSTRHTRVLPASYTTPGQHWMVRARSSDGAAFSDWRGSREYAIYAPASPARLSAVAAATSAGAAITLNLASAARVEASISNLAGRSVAVLTGGDMESGVQTLLWNRRGLSGTLAPAGQYLVRVIAVTADGQGATCVVPLTLQ